MTGAVSRNGSVPQKEAYDRVQNLDMAWFEENSVGSSP